MSERPLLSARGLTKHFPAHKGLLFDRHPPVVRAVDGVDLDVYPGETLGVVGESGCGKSTMARCLVRLLSPTSGSIEFEGREIAGLSRGAVRPLRRDLQMVFQDPYGSLNPRMRVGQIVGEPLDVHQIGTVDERRTRVCELLERVGLSLEHQGRFPHEFSGGQRQRIGIARALALGPKLIVCDEPVSALDVSVQAQILNLLKDLQDELGLAYIFIAHDLSVVKHISNRVMVMYLGRAVEVAPVSRVYRRPRHPYTDALLSAIPIAEPSLRNQGSRSVPTGDVPNPTDPPAGCHFHPRCPRARPGLCDVEDPQLRSLGDSDDDGKVACHLPLDDRDRLLQ